MNKVANSFLKILPHLFGIAVYVFFANAYSAHLHYQEQLQMFLFSSDYWLNTVARPGGLADYLGTFFTQFYYYSWAGALIIAVLLLLLQQQVAMLASRINKKPLFYPLTFLPSIFFWALLCNENYLLAGLLAFVLVLCAVQTYLFLKNPNGRIIALIILLPILYFLLGGVVWIFVILCFLYEWWHFKQFSVRQWTMAFVGVIIITVLTVFVSKLYFQFPLARLCWGLCYNRYPVVEPLPQLVVWLSVVVVLLAVRFIPDKLNKTAYSVVLVMQLVVGLFLGSKLVNFTADWKKEEIMAYDYAVRTQDWQKVVDMANRKDPSSPLSVACLNLALSKQGIMGDCMFRYFQNGTEGLLPTFQRDFTSPFITGEVYYHLGFLNTSMRYAFEAMEAIPDYKKSSRALKRIAEVNLLNGEYKVAAKYLHLLQETMFYSSWATQTLACINNEQLINQNPEWAKLRKYQITNDFLFSEQEKDQMLGLLLTHCPTNKMAFDYLMAYTLLAKDMNHFVQYFPLGKSLGLKEIPAHYQEALIFVWSSTSTHSANMPWRISEPVKQNMAAYARMYSAKQSPEAQIYNSFSQTYWYYFHYRK